MGKMVARKCKGRDVRNGSGLIQGEIHHVDLSFIISKMKTVLFIGCLLG